MDIRSNRAARTGIFPHRRGSSLSGTAIDLPAGYSLYDAGSLEAFLALDPWKVIGPSMLLAGLVSSLVVFFLGLRYSHQIVGPLPRITRALRRIATGAQPERLQFRSGDILEELASEVNQVADRMQLTAKPAPEPRVDPASILGEPRQSQPVGS